MWSPKKRTTAIVLRNEGYSYREIAEKIGGGATFSAVRKLCNKFDKHKTINNLTGRGRKKCTTPHDDRRLVRLSLQDRRRTSNDIRQSLNDSGVTLSSRTVRRRLCDVGLRARVARKKPYLNIAQRKKRLTWAKAHQNWTRDQWRRVIFSDESKISLFGSDGIRYIRRRVGEENLPCCTLPTMKHPVSVMVWGCMSSSGIGRVQVLQGNVTAEKYINSVLQPKLFQSAKDIFGQDRVDRRDFIFQQDGAPCHTARRTTQWFEDNGVEVMPWPGNSPDLNPIENLWARLKKLVVQQKPSNRNELIACIIRSWFHVITAVELENLVDSMPRRCAAVIKAKGYGTKY